MKLTHITLFTTLFLFNCILPNDQQGAIIKINTTTKNKIIYFSIYEFIESQNLKYQYFESKEKLEIKYFNHKMYFSPLSSYFKIDDTIYHLTYSTLYQNKKILIPLDPFMKILKKEKVPIKILSKDNNQITFSSNMYNIHSLYSTLKNNGIEINFSTTKKFHKQNVVTSINKEGWLNITILEGRIDSLGIKKSPLKHPLSRSYTIQSKESAQISLLLNTKVDDINIITTDDNIGILLSINHEDNAQKIKKIRTKKIIDTIVLDAGHGGKDPGAIGINKLQEKTVTLDIVKKLGAMIERNLNMKVIYTRDEDAFVPLWKRTQIANNSGGDVFISIHANSASKHANIYGFETYLLRVGKTKEAIEVAKRENSVIELEESAQKYKNLNDAKLIVATMSQNADMKASEDLAATIQKKLSHNIKSKNRGVKQAGFHVLVGASMPNVLIEVGFLSNKNESNLLGKSTYRREIAKSIYEAILAFKEKHDSEE